MTKYCAPLEVMLMHRVLVERGEHLEKGTFRFDVIEPWLRKHVRRS